MADDKPWGRRLVICCDGTWQSSVSSKDNVPSNVTRLCRVIARTGKDKHDPDKRWHQLVYYDSGVGTGNLSGSEAKRQGGTGAGLAENVIEAYNFIVLNYQPGDEIFCFGFSRGAYTARAVAGLVTDIGVIKTTEMQLFPAIYRAYMSNDEMLPFRETQAWKDFVEGKLTKKGEELMKSRGIQSLRDKVEAYEIIPHKNLLAVDSSHKVKVVGVWDTVGSLGVPDVAWFDNEKLRAKYAFHNVRLNENIEHAYHALALDERRGAFRPTLWYIDHQMRAKLAREGKPIPELKQVWFPGVHINSGGGSDDCIGEMKGDLENLSTASWTWMLQCISPHLTIDQDAFKASLTQYQRFLARIRYACTFRHPGWVDTVKSFIPPIPLLNPAPDPLEPPKRAPVHTHPDFDFGWGTGPIIDSYTGMYLLAKSLPRVPGKLQTEVYDEKKKTTTLQDISELGESHEYIHPICEYRKIVRSKKDTSALELYTRRHEKNPDGTEGRFWWYRDGKRLPEWVILEHKDEGIVNFERTWYEMCEQTEEAKMLLKEAGYGKDFLLDLDKRIDFGVGKQPAYMYP